MCNKYYHGEAEPEDRFKEGLRCMHVLMCSFTAQAWRPTSDPLAAAPQLLIGKLLDFWQKTSNAKFFDIRCCFNNAAGNPQRMRIYRRAPDVFVGRDDKIIVSVTYGN